jgi:hypothetical protein
MGKKLLSTLLFLPALAIAQVDYVQFETVCVSKKMLDETVAKHGEKPFVIAVGHRLVDEKKVFHPVIMFMNPNTKTWTLVERIEPDTFCVVGVGSKMEPFFSK